MKPKHLVRLTGTFLCAALLLCCRSPRSENLPGKPTAKAPIAETLRIASMAPSCTSILAGLGLASSIVAIDTWSEKLEAVPKTIPSFDMLKPDMERLASLAPDLLLVSSMTKAGSSRDPFKPLSDSGIHVVYIPTSSSIAEIRADVAMIAELTGTQDEGSTLTAQMDGEISRISAIAQTIPASARKTVYFEISPAPDIYSFGRGVYLDELLEIAGASNILKGETGWLAVSAETVAKLNPDVILTNVSYLPDPVAEIASRKGWAEVAALKAGRIYLIDNIHSSQPAPAAIRALNEIAEAVYPEYFK